MNKLGNETKCNVCLTGASFDTNNRGVSALSSSLVRLITDLLPNANISFFEGNPKRLKKTVSFAGKELLIDVINYRVSPKAKLPEHIFILLFLVILVRLFPVSGFQKWIIKSNSRLHDLHDCDFVAAMNGGDSFSDIYGIRRFIEGRLPIFITILLRKRLILLPQTYGPYNSRLARSMTRWIINRASLIFSRDLDSIALVEKFVNKKKRNKLPIQFCPDVAFTLPSSFPSTFTIYPPINDFGNKIWVGINVNGLLFNGGYSRANMFGLRFEYKIFMLRLIENLMKETDIRIALVPHTYGEKDNINSDTEASRQVFEMLKDKYKNRLYVVQGEYKEFEVKGIIGRCSFFVGSRMHACIASISQGIPTAAVAYSKKFHGVFASIGLESMVVDARMLDIDEAIDRIVYLYKNRNIEQAAIRQKVDSAKEQVKKTFTKMLSHYASTERGN